MTILLEHVDEMFFLDQANNLLGDRSSASRGLNEKLKYNNFLKPYSKEN
jgi:hypothetical protein